VTKSVIAAFVVAVPPLARTLPAAAAYEDNPHSLPFTTFDIFDNTYIMVNLSQQKRLAASVAGVGQRKSKLYDTE
jgi:hypothetical protein